MEQAKGYARILTAQPLGIDAELVMVEADLSRGLHAFSIVGLADKAVAEARDRISSAIKNSGFKPPKATNRRIVLSLSPASLRKDGSQYDLPLAVAYLVAAGFISPPVEQMLFCGELGLDGTVRPIRNVLAHALCARTAGITKIVVPAGNAEEALLVQGMRVYPVTNLKEVINHLNGNIPIHPARRTDNLVEDQKSFSADFSNIQGQESAKRALLIAAAGRHNVMLYGPPGTGKTMLARALPTILPPLSEPEMLSTTAIHGAAGELSPGHVVTLPPFRAPHHSISTSAMVGGGPHLRPGEISLAHAGVLFMDEFVEFDARTLEALRQPLEDRAITIARTKGALTLPADFMLIGAMNPADTLTGDDAVVRLKAQRQAQKLSRPIIDRIDLWVEVPRRPYRIEHSTRSMSDSVRMREQVRAARAHMTLNSNTIPPYTKGAYAVLQTAGKRLSLSARSAVRVLRVARTIAALADREEIDAEHIIEALQYRPRAPFG